MRPMNLAFILAALLGGSGTLEAQSREIPGVTVGTPMGDSYGHPNYSPYGYARAYRVPAPAPVVRYRPANPYGYVNRPYYGAYGYGNYSNGSTDGFPPFRGRWAR